ncbi:HofP DNA utilization family protein [Atlantibacter sp.]|uniref:HofP DNA utilization family protein n=1 Tax=Atlantibacter sp. TaxID=1903473 RepID=UPI0028AF10D3|nr:HofP DNA utilization family protein [Atlantibacter sp.]
MKNSFAVMSLMCCLAVDAAPRDPFQAPINNCPYAQWETWRFHGAVGNASSIKALIESPEGKWLRVSPGQTLSSELQVKEITAAAIIIAIPAACDKGEIRWQRKEKFNGKDVQISRADAAPAERAGRKTGK